MTEVYFLGELSLLVLCSMIIYVMLCSMTVLTGSTGLGGIGWCTGNSPIHCQYVNDGSLQLAKNQHQLQADKIDESWVAFILGLGIDTNLMIWFDFDSQVCDSIKFYSIYLDIYQVQYKANFLTLSTQKLIITCKDFFLIMIRL